MSLFKRDESVLPDIDDKGLVESMLPVGQSHAKIYILVNGERLSLIIQGQVVRKNMNPIYICTSSN